MNETPEVKGNLNKKSSQKSNRSSAVLKIPAKSTISGNAEILALFAGLIFVSHPLQTQAITYIMQRAAALATLFYLATLCFYVKSRLSGNSGALGKFYYACALLMAVAAMFTKEIAITLPVLILLYEFCFFKLKQSFNWKIVLPFLLTIVTIPLTMSLTKAINSSEMKHVMEGSTDVTTLQYVLSQLRVMLTYFRLLVLPINQNLDYDYPVSHSLFELPTLIGFLILGGIFYLTIRLFSKYRLIAFSIMWFFVTLLPESSFFPMKDVIFEHRLYLPLTGYCMLLVSGMYYLLGRKNLVIMGIVLTLIVGANSVLTYQRNKVWKDEFTLWDDTVRKSPHKARPYNNRGLAYDKQGNTTQALSDYNKAIEFDPKYELPYNNRGVIYNRQEDLALAVSDFNKAIELSPGTMEPYMNRGSTYNKAGNFTQALADFNKAIELNPNVAKAYDYRGVVYDKLGYVTQALADFNKALEMDPNDPETYSNQGSTYEGQGDLTQAISDYNKSIELNPNYAIAYYNLGGVYDKQGDLAQSLSDYNKAIEINPSYAEAYNNRGSVYAKQGFPAQAIADLTKAIELDPKYAVAFTNRGLTYVNGGSLNLAIADFDKAIEIDPNNVDAYYNRGNAHDHNKDFTQAIADYTKAIEINPKYADAYVNRGAIYAAQNQFAEEAISDFRKVIELNPNNSGAYTNLGLMYDKQGDSEKAMSNYNKAIELNPQFAAAYNNRAVTYYELKDYDKAWTDVHKVEELKADVNPGLLKALIQATGKEQ